MAKKRAAFLLKQQKKAEEARLRKQQLEAESELKRDEARYFIAVDIIMRFNKLPLAFISCLLVLTYNVVLV